MMALLMLLPLLREHRRTYGGVLHGTQENYLMMPI
jgi:hypothetical protein